MPSWLPPVLTLAGAIFLTWAILAALFTPAVEYRLRKRVDVSSPEFLHFLHSTCQSEVYDGNRITIFRNGDRFYPPMLDAIRHATRSVNLECYIFEDGMWGRRFVDALCERARAGVVVTVV